jgi:hypothetical protein
LTKIIVHEDFWRNLKLKSFNFQQLFFFFCLILLVSKFWQNLTIKLAKVVTLKKTKTSKIFPISLLKNDEISPGKKTLLLLIQEDFTRIIIPSTFFSFLLNIFYGWNVDIVGWASSIWVTKNKDGWFFCALNEKW